jgi:hypothetical protein
MTHGRVTISGLHSTGCTIDPFTLPIQQQGVAGGRTCVLGSAAMEIEVGWQRSGLTGDDGRRARVVSACSAGCRPDCGWWCPRQDSNLRHTV